MFRGSGALEGKPQPVRAGDVIDSIREVGLFSDFRESDFWQELESSPAAELAVSYASQQFWQKLGHRARRCFPC